MISPNDVVQLAAAWLMVNNHRRFLEVPDTTELPVHCVNALQGSEPLRLLETIVIAAPTRPRRRWNYCFGTNQSSHPDRQLCIPDRSFPSNTAVAAGRREWSWQGQGRLS
jgi:hypothetical protein